MPTKHTPGPWKRSEDDPYTIIGPDMMAVAHIAYSCTIKKGEPDYSEMEGNAIIIEASTEMYAALQSATEVLDEILEYTDGEDGEMIKNPLLNKLHDLLSRIDGTQR